MTEATEAGSEAYKAWIGRSAVFDDVATLSPVARMSATLDRDDPPPTEGDALPPGWHWLYFLPDVQQSRLGPDGHGARGAFLPPVELPRRMWAGSRFDFRRPIRLGTSVQRRTTIVDVVSKTGRNGPLVFVNLRHDILAEGDVAVAEEQDLVYRQAPQPGEAPPPPQPIPDAPQWERTIEPDPVLLFRFSALTFNGHRIHYDHPYVTRIEGYPGLVVHGPLLGILLLDLIRRHVTDRPLASFRFRALRPVFDISPFRIQGRRDGDAVTVWALDNGDDLAMTAEGTLG